MNVEKMSYQNMTPQEQAAHDKLMNPQKFTNSAEDIGGNKYSQPAASGLADFFGFGMNPQQKRKDSNEDMEGDVHRKQKDPKGNKVNSEPTIKSENGSDQDKEY